MSNYDNTNTFVLFINDKKSNEKAPDLKGKANINGIEKDMAVWIREGKNGKFYSGKISEPFKKDSELPPMPKAKSQDLPF